LHRAEVLEARRAPTQMFVRRIVDWPLATGKRSEDAFRRTPLSRRIGVGASEQEVDFVFDLEWERVSALTVIRHRLSQCRCRIATKYCNRCRLTTFPTTGYCRSSAVARPRYRITIRCKGLLGDWHGADLIAIPGDLSHVSARVAENLAHTCAGIGAQCVAAC